jgi:hypothetical protein
MNTKNKKQVKLINCNLLDVKNNKLIKMEGYVKIVNYDNKEYFEVNLKNGDNYILIGSNEKFKIFDKDDDGGYFVI